ncbi:MAG: penicillin-binding protein activator [Rhodospirillaceae bacterium]|nr:penicillin-binding protein activator [Rhodospirillaceae bacterium]
MTYRCRSLSLLLAGMIAFAVAACASSPDVAPQAPRAKASATAPAAKAPQAKTSQKTPLIGSAPSVPTPVGRQVRPRTDASGMVRVGLLVPLTGTSAPTGQGILNAAEMALFEIGDENLVLQIYDTQGTPEGAVIAANKALSEGAQLFLGPLFAGEVKAITPQAQAAGVNIIGFTTDPAVQASNVFVLGFLVEAQVREVLTYARSQGRQHFAVLAPSNVYGQSVVDSINTLVPSMGGTVSKVAYFNPSGSDLEDVVRRFADFDKRKAALQAERNTLSASTDEVSQLALKRLEQQETLGDVDFDAVFIPESGGRLIQVANLLPFFDIDTTRVQLMGTMLWATRGLGRESAMVGGIYPAPAQDANRDFAQRYRQTFGGTPPALANHGYDAVALAAVLVRSGSADPFRHDAIADPGGFAGVDGIFRFRSNGLSERGFAIMQITRDGADVVRPAPKDFDDAQY